MCIDLPGTEPDSDVSSFIGLPCTCQDLVSICLTGHLRHRTHTLSGGWLDWGDLDDTNDTELGFVDLASQVIDGIAMSLPRFK